MNKHFILYPILLIVISLFSINTMANKDVPIHNPSDEYTMMYHSMERMNNALQENTELLKEMNASLQKNIL